jgi:hypothetical protein
VSRRSEVQRHGVRAFDTIDLASALALQAVANESDLFAADQRLWRATVNPGHPEAIDG